MYRIMIIDDDISVNDMIVQWLSNVGYEAEGVTDAGRGLKLLNTRAFDLIITEIVMPEKEGLEMILAIRKTNKITPIIAISGGGKIAPQLYLEIARIFGANCTFKKPISAEPFLVAVQECLIGRVNEGAIYGNN